MANHSLTWQQTSKLKSQPEVLATFVGHKFPFQLHEALSFPWTPPLFTAWLIFDEPNKSSRSLAGARLQGAWRVLLPPSPRQEIAESLGGGPCRSVLGYHASACSGGASRCSVVCLLSRFVCCVCGFLFFIIRVFACFIFSVCFFSREGLIGWIPRTVGREREREII